MLEVIDNKFLKYYGKTIPANHVVYALMGPILKTRTQTSIQIGENMHIEDVLGKYVLHSDKPTVKVVDSCLVAINDVNEGDFITISSSNL